MEEVLQRGIKEENNLEKRLEPLLEQGEQRKREDQTADRDGATKTFKAKMRHLT